MKKFEPVVRGKLDRSSNGSYRDGSFMMNMQSPPRSMLTNYENGSKEYSVSSMKKRSAIKKDQQLFEPSDLTLPHIFERKNNSKLIENIERSLSNPRNNQTSSMVQKEKIRELKKDKNYLEKRTPRKFI